jgi:hypothetical protein
MKRCPQPVSRITGVAGDSDLMASASFAGRCDDMSILAQDVLQRTQQHRVVVHQQQAQRAPGLHLLSVCTTACVRAGAAMRDSPTTASGNGARMILAATANALISLFFFPALSKSITGNCR